MRQAIITRFIAPTETQGQRVKAISNAFSITIPWDYSLDSEANHSKAAHQLARKLGWVRDGIHLEGGYLPEVVNGVYAFVLVGGI